MSGLYANLPGWLSVVPEEYRDVSIDSCDKLPKSLVEFGIQWYKSLPLKSLYLYGQYGSGKTTYSFALLRAVMEHWSSKIYIWPRYFTGKDLDSKLLAASKNYGSDDWDINCLSDCEILFLDDLDKASCSDRFRLQLFQIINKRFLSKLPTIITSNCEPSQMGDLLDGAVVSRIGDPSKWQIIQFPDSDLRKFNKMVF